MADAAVGGKLGEGDLGDKCRGQRDPNLTLPISASGRIQFSFQRG